MYERKKKKDPDRLSHVSVWQTIAHSGRVFLNAINSAPTIDETLFREEQRAITRTTAGRFIAPVNFIIRIRMYG